MTKHEAAIVSAFTGIMLGNFQDLHEYAEKLLKRPIFTHEFAFLKETLKEASRPDFKALHDSVVGEVE